MNEFDVIEKYFAPLSKGDLKNDAAVIDVPDGCQMVVTTDTLNAGRHFMPDATPDQIATKCLRTNISDLYAMGATPMCYQLSIAYPEKPDEPWIQTFTDTLKREQNHFGVYCSGGDTTTIDGALSVSITAIGYVETGKAWTRSGAEEGDAIALSGFIGDAWIGLQILQGNLKTEDDDYFINAYYAPQITSPSFTGGIEGGSVKAAIDISDGFIADLNHICKQSGVGVIVNVDNIPFSNPTQKLLDQKVVTYEQLLTGGDDYALIMACDEGRIPENANRIGVFTARDTIICNSRGDKIEYDKQGWTHF